MPSALEQFNVSAVDAALDGHLASEADTTACPSSPLRMPENSVPLSFGIGTVAKGVVKKKERKPRRFGMPTSPLEDGELTQSRTNQLDANRLAAGAQPSTIDDRTAGELATMVSAASSGTTRGGQI